MSTKRVIQCPHCSADIIVYKNPVPTVDIIIETDGGIVLIDRQNAPFGWAIPGGFVDYGESAPTAAKREAKEETSLDVELVAVLGVYSDPSRDPRQHTISTVFVAKAEGIPSAADDAKDAAVFRNKEDLPDNIVFDHLKIINDYFKWKELTADKKQWNGLFFT
ncbi:NUDIX hydrolase [bacterium]|nr:NUDIX hydrolase [bacterium]